jgi:hypothetical protein
MQAADHTAIGLAKPICEVPYLGLAGRSIANQLANRWEGEQWSAHQLAEQDSSLEMVIESSTASQRQLVS